MDSFERSQEPQLPSKDGFYSSVTEEDILKTNLQTCATNIIVWILPIITYTSPYLFWKAALTMTDVELDLVTDIDQYHFIKERIKAGWH